MGMSLEKLVVCFLLGVVTWASISVATMDGGHTEKLQDECSHTRYPNLCVQTLIGMGSGKQSADIIPDLVNKTMSETMLPSSYYAEFGSLLEAQDDPHSHSVKGICISLYLQRGKPMFNAFMCLHNV
ncbi:hypothetical protein L6164_011867 [Bauhinia variegata]|uniref:Uncharacterized protein n=1 Tax=Bauhinia variegata TaxID=167791 RepID=A0ACB9P8A9_BAUVA|nr:hypothetical protein L6164_011867 [Bauhinia variegata]